ncbi:MAG: Asp-tRNA(Asn)/Glu-tRNA(Gln) amidotransferase subunit GatC [Dehalococcoidia bacterium]
MALTRAEVEHVARLAHVGVTEAEIERLRSQLSQILDSFAVLNGVDTENVPPTAHTLPLENVERPDQSRPSPPRDEMLQNAPLRDRDYFRVRKVLD